MPAVKQVILSTVFFGLLSGWCPDILAQALCDKPPPTTSLDRTFLSSLDSLPGKSKTKLLLVPFEDGSQLLTPDTPLTQAFLFSLYDLLSSSSEAGVLHPFISMDMARQKPAEHAFDETPFLEAARESKATHLILGLFQKGADQTVRLFIKAVDVARGQALGAPLEFSLPQNDRFFSVMAEAARSILALTGGGKTQSFDAYLAKVPSFEAFRYYVKGMEKSSSYHPVDLEVAKAWFEKALTLSYHFENAQEEKKRVLWMLSLYKRQMGMDVNLLLAEAGTAKTGRTQRLSPARWARAMDLASQSRWLAPAKASALLKQAVALTPEDGALLHELARRLKETGAPYEEVWQRASTLNPCVSPL